MDRINIDLKLPRLTIHVKTEDDRVRLLKWVDDVVAVVEKAVRDGINAGLDDVASKAVSQYGTTVARQVKRDMAAAFTRADARAEREARTHRRLTGAAHDA